MNHIEPNIGAIRPGDCISEAWSLVTGKLGLYIGLGIVAALLMSCIPIVNLFLAGPVMGGFFYTVLRDQSGEPVEFGNLFKGFDRFVPLMVIGLILQVPAIIYQILNLTLDLTRLLMSGAGGSPSYGDISRSDVPFGGGAIAWPVIALMVGVWLIMIVWGLLLTFAIPLSIDKGLSVGDAIKGSMNAVMGNLGGVIVLIILQGLVVIAGFLVFCVGLIVAMPVVYAATAIAYRQVFPPSPDGPTFSSAPPPPTEYGFGAGL